MSTISIGPTSKRAEEFARAFLNTKPAGTNRMTPDMVKATMTKLLDEAGTSPLELELRRLATKSPVMLAIKDRIRAITNRTEPVLILGDTGTGKELVARAIHGAKFDLDMPFVAENCAAIPEGLAATTFFGSKKGSYTGSVADTDGKLVEAAGGTIFLDEVGSMSPAIQNLLLRAIQENEIYPVGSVKPVKISCRFVAATSRDLRELVDKGKFLIDLYYRLNTFTIRIPPFRERPDDINVIAESLGYKDGIDPAYHEEVFRGGVRAIQTYISRMSAYGDWRE